MPSPCGMVTAHKEQMNFHFNPQVNNLTYFPRKYANQAILYYIFSLGVCSILFMGHAMPIYIIMMGVVSIVLFFLGSCTIGRQWRRLPNKIFVKKIFWFAFAIRLGYAIFIFFMNKYQYGTFYESNDGDITWYVPTALESIQKEGGFFNMLSNWNTYSTSIPDAGYQWWLAFLFTLEGALSNPVVGSYIKAAEAYLWLPMILKALFGAWTCVFMYRIAQRHFGENVARMTAIFCMLQMNMIWWCGSFMKETEMVFVATFFVNRMDKTLQGRDLKPWSIALTMAIGLIIFGFRSALFMVAIAATVFSLVMQNSKKMSVGKKVLAGLMIAVAMGFAVGDTIKAEVTSIIETAQNRDRVQTNMEWRTRRSHGNQFAKYAGAAVFAPLIFTIPFPSMVYTHQAQEMQMQVNGGNFEKNVLSFFVIFALFQLLFSGQWRQHVFPIAFMMGYLAALVLSEFAQSGRFHMPVMPFLMMFAAYGLTIVTSKKHKQWFSYALMVEVVFCVAWSWFKLKGQGQI